MENKKEELNPTLKRSKDKKKEALEKALRENLQRRKKKKGEENDKLCTASEC